MREYFCAYHSMLGGTRKLSDAECGRLFRALLRYSSGTDVELINLQGREEVLFDVYSQQIDRDAEAYEKKCQINRANASENKRPQANGSDRKRTVADGSDRAQDKDKDEYKDKDDDLKKRFDDHWRTSARARAAVAQTLIDEISAALGKCPFTDMHQRVCEALENGIEPELILDGIDKSRNWSNINAWIAYCEMQGGSTRR